MQNWEVYAKARLSLNIGLQICCAEAPTLSPSRSKVNSVQNHDYDFSANNHLLRLEQHAWSKCCFVSRQLFPQVFPFATSFSSLFSNSVSFFGFVSFCFLTFSGLGTMYLTSDCGIVETWVCSLFWQPFNLGFYNPTWCYLDLAHCSLLEPLEDFDALLFGELGEDFLAEIFVFLGPTYVAKFFKARMWLIVDRHEM